MVEGEKIIKKQYDIDDCCCLIKYNSAGNFAMRCISHIQIFNKKQIHVCAHGETCTDLVWNF